MQKFSQGISLVVSILTLIILLLFLFDKPNFDLFAQKSDVQNTMSKVQLDVEKEIAKLKESQPKKDTDKQYAQLTLDNKNLKQSYGKLSKENKALLAEIQEVRSELDTLKKKLNKKPTTKKPEVLKTEKVVVKVGLLNFRNYPTIKAPIRATLVKNTKLEVINKTVYEKDGHRWVHVKLKSGEKGYIAREYVK